MWSGNGLASWQLICITDSSPVCRSIWYQEYPELGSWENFSLWLLWGKKKKALGTLCVLHIIHQIFSKNLRTNQNRFHYRNIICHLWWRLFITFKAEISLHDFFYNGSYFGGLRMGKLIKLKLCGRYFLCGLKWRFRSQDLGSSIHVHCILHPRSMQNKWTMIIIVIKCVDSGVGQNLRLLAVWLTYNYLSEPASKLRRVISTLQSCKDSLLYYILIYI